MLGGLLLEAENKRIWQTSSLKTGRGHLRNLIGGYLKLYLNPPHSTSKRKRNGPHFVNTHNLLYAGHYLPQSR